MKENDLESERWPRILPANPYRTLKNLNVHGSTGYQQKAQESSRNSNIVYKPTERNARGNVAPRGREREREMESTIKKTRQWKPGDVGRCLLRRIQRRNVISETARADKDCKKYDVA